MSDAIAKAIEALPDYIDVYRIMRDAKSRKTAVMAKAVAEEIERIRAEALAALEGGDGAQSGWQPPFTLQWESGPGHRWRALNGLYEIVRNGARSKLLYRGDVTNLFPDDPSSNLAMRAAQIHYETKATIGEVLGWTPNPAREEAEALVKIKPLVWEKHPMGWIAAPPTGQAYIIDIRIKDRVMFVKGMNPAPQCSNVDEAKSKAQADYEARILAALELSPSPDALVAAAYEAAAKTAEYRDPSNPFAPRDDKGQRIAISIRSLTPADARAQLDAMLKDARNEGIEAVAKIADECPDSHWGPWLASRARALKTED